MLSSAFQHIFASETCNIVIITEFFLDLSKYRDVNIVFKNENLFLNWVFQVSGHNLLILRPINMKLACQNNEQDVYLYSKRFIDIYHLLSIMGGIPKCFLIPPSFKKLLYIIVTVPLHSASSGNVVFSINL